MSKMGALATGEFVGPWVREITSARAARSLCYGRFVLLCVPQGRKSCLIHLSHQGWGLGGQKRHFPCSLSE